MKILSLQSITVCILCVRYQSPYSWWWRSKEILFVINACSRFFYCVTDMMQLLLFLYVNWIFNEIFHCKMSSISLMLCPNNLISLLNREDRQKYWYYWAKHTNNVKLTLFITKLYLFFFSFAGKHTWMPQIHYMILK